jgi:hypothetical protein
LSDLFSAAPSALGYFYQCEVALLELLDRDDPALELSIELLDDIAFEGAQTELLQSKLQITAGSLTDGSADLWKTLRVWSEAEASYPEALLVLVTTAEAPEGSIAAALRSDDRRDADSAHDRLIEHARNAAGVTLARARTAFLGLGEERRREMVRRIVVADKSPGIQDLDDQFAGALRHAAPRDRRPALIRRLREWWLLRAEQHLVQVATGEHPRISGIEIENRIGDLRDQLSAQNLPIDVEEMTAPTDQDVADDQRTFVMQLRLIALANARIRNAVHDYNRAFAQRARWVREDLVEVGELERYERRLQEEWNRLWLPDTDDDPEAQSENDARGRGRDVQLACERAMFEPIRPRVAAPYIQRGSMHILADELRVGWHPDWVARMRQLLEGATT